MPDDVRAVPADAPAVTAMRNVRVFDKDWRTYPKFRHNLWTAFAAEPETTYLTVSQGVYEVPTPEAQRFLSIRSHCTGHNTIAEIARRSGVAENSVTEIVTSLHEADVTRPQYRRFADMTQDDLRDVLFAACRIWGEQLRETGMGPKLASGAVDRNVVIGWVLEMNHYVRNFPAAVAVAASHATGELQAVLADYAAQEFGHESFVVGSLVKLGFTAAEAETSIPLVSTRLIDLLMRELFAMLPCAALLLASIVEAGELEDGEAQSFFDTLAEKYSLPIEAFAPIQEHMIIDSQLGHAELAEKYRHLITIGSEEHLHEVMNKLHDIKHAFDLQQMEIEHYYSQRGNYIPRQYVDFFGI